MPPFHSVNIAAPAQVVEAAGTLWRLGALPAQRRPLAVGERVANDRVLLEAGARLVLQVEGGERLTVEVRAQGPRAYFFHIVEGEQIGHRLMK